jgi:pyruvate dehydrogenase complex dehydrogenase (E1) component
MDMRDILPDTDPQETREWLEALESVLEREGPDRAHFLLEKLVDKARNSGAYIPFNANTAYMNTIPLSREERSPGDAELEHKIRSLVRWNAMAMVVRANKESSELGGHIASFASAATLYDVGFNHFFRAASENFAGDLVYIQGHSAPGIYARAYLEGRITEEQLAHFRREVDGKGLPSYPHPWLMREFWQFPTVSMGLGPLMAIYQARFMRYLKDRNLIEAQGRKVWCFCGDGEMDEPESLGSISLAGREPGVRHQLQSATPRRSGARQWQDHSGTRERFPRRGLERDQGDLGFVLGPAVHARQNRHSAQAHGRMRRRRIPGVQVARRRFRAQAFFWQVSRARRHGGEHVR